MAAAARSWTCSNRATANRWSTCCCRSRGHDPEKWTPVFGSDHAQLKSPELPHLVANLAADEVFNAASGSSPAGGRAFFPSEPVIGRRVRADPVARTTAECVALAR